MNLWLVTLRLAVRSLRRNPLRSSLTSLGVIVGVAAVISMVSLGQGARAALQEQIASVGTNMVMIFPGATTTSGARAGWGTGARLTVADARALSQQVEGLRGVAYHRRDVAQVQAGGANWTTTIWGVPPSYTTVREWPVVAGDFISQSQNDTAAKVAVLGQTVATMLFGEGVDPVGAEIRIKDVPFKVIGLLAAKGQSAYGQDQDDAVFIPFSTAERKVLGTSTLGTVDMIQLSLDGSVDEEDVIEQVTTLLRERRRIQPGEEDDFGIRTIAEMAQAADSMASVMTNLLLAIASISLLVGGIGIMNILLVSVTERTREIGIRMAVGAKARHILAQFLLEAVTLSGLGGVVGIVLGIFVAHVISRISGWPTLVSPLAIMVSFLFSAFVGVFFGFYPAHKASRLDPIAALRHAA
ncbi:MAG TPA: ABC transporter permease [Candidatus Binatia bacterium]